MSKHSPAPWRVGGDCRLGDGDGEPHWVELSNGRCIWDVNNEPVFELRDWWEEADLTVAAAAPQLLEALRHAANCGTLYCPTCAAGYDLIRQIDGEPAQASAEPPPAEVP